MGVELGKILAKNILAQLNKPEDVTGHDSSVRPLLTSCHNIVSDVTDDCVYRPLASFTTTRSIGRSESQLLGRSFDFNVG